VRVAEACCPSTGPGLIGGVVVPKLPGYPLGAQRRLSTTGLTQLKCACHDSPLPGAISRLWCVVASSRLTETLLSENRLAVQARRSVDAAPVRKLKLPRLPR